MRPRLPYGGVHHLQGRESAFQQELGNSTEVTPYWMRRWLSTGMSQQFSLSVVLTCKRRPQLPEHRLLVWRCGLVTTGKRLVVWKRKKNQKHSGRNSPSVPLLWDETQKTQAHDLGGAVVQTCHDLVGEAPPILQKLQCPHCMRFFWAHAVHARGKSKKPGVFQNQNKTNPTKQKTKTPQSPQV